MTLLLNIDVPDIAAAERFYTEAFDLKPGRRFADGFIELRGWAAPLYLLEKAAGTTGAGSDLRRYQRHWTPIHFDIVVEDLDIALKRCLMAGATIEHGPRTAPYGRIAVFADPFGNGFCLIQFNGAGYDALLEPSSS